MVRNKNNWLVFNFFSRYISRRVYRYYHQIEFDKIEIDPEKAVLLIANHYSWWDGFMFFHLNKLLFKKKYHIMILEETILKNKFMKYTGAFSVSKGSKNILETLEYAGTLLNDPKNLLLIFPQGKLFSNFVETVSFEKGLTKIIGFSQKNFQYVFAASFTEHFSRPKPTAFIYLKSEGAANFGTLADVVAAYQKHYRDSKKVQSAIVK